MKTVRKIIAHASIVLGGMLLTLFILDKINPAMEFIDNDITRGLIAAAALLGIVSGVFGLIVPKDHDKPNSR